VLRVPLALLLAALLAPTLWRTVLARPPRACLREGRGTAPRGWVGCAGDPGPARDLAGAERLALGQPLDLNRASAVDLSGVPGLSLRLGEAVVADRTSRGPFERVEELVRVKGVGPARLARARPFLETKPGSSAVAGSAPVE